MWHSIVHFQYFPGLFMMSVPQYLTWPLKFFLSKTRKFKRKKNS